MAKENLNLTNNIPAEMLLNISKEQKELVESILSKKLPSELENIAMPLKLKERKEFKDFLNGDNKEYDEVDFAVELAEQRGMALEILEEFEVSDLLMFAKKVILLTTDPYAIAVVRKK